MPYTMEFYSLDWSELGKALGSSNHDLVDQIDKENGDNFFRSEEDQENRLIWRKLLEALVLGRRGKALAARGPEGNQLEEVSDIAELALVGIVRTLGVNIGSLEHSTRGGSLFRDQLFAKEAPKIFNAPVVLTQLIERPLFGTIHSGAYPSLGGLKKSEIELLLKNLSDDDIPEFDDSDIEGWFYDLYTCLRIAQEEETDIITVYF